MLVTGRPLIAQGITTAPPRPVYLAMEIMPLLMVKVDGTSEVPNMAGRPPNVVPQPVVYGRE